MPAAAVPVVIAVVCFFSIFVAVIGGVSLWTYLPDSRKDV